MTDEQLFSHYLEGDQSAFEELVTRYRSHLINYIRDRVRDPEDVVQDVFLKIYAEPHMYDRNRPFRPWLFTLVIRRAIDVQRYEGRRYSIQEYDGMISLQEALGHSGSKDKFCKDYCYNTDLDFLEVDLLRKAILALPNRLRETLCLKWFTSATNQEVADKLGIAVNTVKNRHNLAKKTLRHTMEVSI